MRNFLLYGTISAILSVMAPVAANADSRHHDNGHHEGWHHDHHEHINYVYWHGHHGYWNGPRFVMVEEVAPPVVVPAYYPEPYPQPIYYEPAPALYYNTVIR